jgi:hypothetical protein
VRDPHGPYGAVLIVRIWFDAPPSHSTLRARIISSDDPTRTDADSVVVAGTEQTLRSIREWLEGYVASAGNASHGRP